MAGLQRGSAASLWLGASGSRGWVAGAALQKTVRDCPAHRAERPHLPRAMRGKALFLSIDRRVMTCPSILRVSQPEIVTLCGSIRFAAEHLAAHRRLSLEGRMVLLPAFPMHGEDLLPADVGALTLDLGHAVVG